jgi:hypothetical protein
MMLHCRSMAFEDEGGTLCTVTGPPDEEFLSVCREFGISMGSCGQG